MILWAHPSPQAKRYLNRISRFCTDDRRRSLYFTMGRPFHLRTVLSHWRISTPCNTWFPKPTRVLNPNGISIGSAVFGRPFVKRFAQCYRTVVCTILPVTLVYCGQTVGWIKMPCTWYGHIALGGDPVPPQKGAQPISFSPCLLWPNGWMDQDVTV